jgi:hypothetical protein
MGLSRQQQFFALFRGFSKAKGAYRIERKNAKGKQVGRAVTVIDQLTEYDWKIHLDGGDPGLGVIPLDDDNNCSWGAIDVDIINLDLAETEQKIKQNGLPLVVFRSKSGGAHLIVFFQEPVPAEDVVELLGAWASVLGFGGHEIFPKQTYRANESDIGNWLNMPYYEGDNSLRYAIRDGQALSVNEFLEWVPTQKESVENLTLPDPKSELFEEGPPCLKSIEAAGGFPDGMRNEGMFSVCVYLRKRFHESWADSIYEYATAMTDPVLKGTEINELIKSASKKDYQYKCKIPPLQPHCNRQECLRQQYGVGSGGGESEYTYFEELTRLLGDEVLWMAQVNGRRMVFTTDELYSPIAFAKRVAEETGNPPDPPPVARWHRHISKMIRESASEQPPVEDVTTEGAFKYFLDRFLTGNARCMTKDELATRDAPWYDYESKLIRFQQMALMTYFSAQGYKSFGSGRRVAELLRQVYPSIAPEQVWLSKSSRRLWAIPLQDLPGHEEEAEGEKKPDDNAQLEDF